ncbi:LpqB family beta-propeller domain-containing protein [uncultured Jatrophihabitans sp.]|uniref:LpqB family beta-propeller domain-containing protein n=1 Tax=uncultured Jatrophihabitans sp. TaxID=1610747 RepID=UPI0035CB66FB
MTGSRRRVIALALFLAVVLGLAACTGVPSSSRPQAIQSLGLGEESSAPARPPPNVDPRSLLSYFGEASQYADQNFTAARQYLSRDAQRAWSTGTATVISNNPVISKWDSRTGDLQVEGREIGTVNSAGVYQPSLYGVGDGAPQSFKYRVQMVGGQYRITSAYPGVLLTSDQFRDTFQQRVLYYVGPNSQLVPVPRFSALSQPTQVANWMLAQLAANTQQPDVQAISANLDTVPAPARVSDDGDIAQVQITGSSALPAAARNVLAAQISQTLDGVISPSFFELYDGRRPVNIPQAGGVRFRAQDFTALRGPPAPAADLYYVSPPSNQIRTARGLALTGPVARSVFRSIALARPAAIGQLTIAGVQPTTSTTGTLVIGTQSGGVKPTSVRGVLSRPAWAPGRAEVWTAAGTTVYRVTTDGRSATVHRVTVQLPFQASRVSALRLSPDGSRIAMVISGASNSGQLFVGPVLRSSTDVQVGKLVPVSPEGVLVKDAAWIDAVKLIVIGDVGSSGGPHVFTSYIDGSGWAGGTTAGLPGPADTVTIANDARAWVSADGDVWEQSATGWSGPLRSGQTAGVAPVYLG